MKPQITVKLRMSGPRVNALRVLFLMILWAAGCGPPSFDLTVRVTETDGTAIPQASVTLLELREVQVTDEAGETTWTDLEIDSAALYVSAEGYGAYADRLTLERGQNEAVVQLERAPIEPDVPGP